MGWIDAVRRRMTASTDANNVVNQARRHVYNHRAAEVAASLMQRRVSMGERTKFSSETEDLCRQLTEFRKCSLEAELALRQVVMIEMKSDEKILTLFEIFDVNKSGFVNTNDLTQCLLKIDPQRSQTEALNAARMSVSAFDSDHNGRLDLKEFQVFLAKLAEQVDCAVECLVRFLILRVVSSDNGPTVVGETVVNSSLLENWNPASSGTCRNDKFVQARITILFQALDYNRTGVVEFEAIVLTMYHVAQDMDARFRQILFAFNEKEQRTLNLSEFAEFMCNVVAASPAHVGIHEVSNSMTLMLFCNDCYSGSKVDYSELFEEFGLYVASEQENSMQGTTQTTTKIPVTPLDHGRMTRLFDLWDLNHNGYIEFSEFFLGLRKFHENKDLDTTFLETAAAISRFDGVNEKNGKLDRIEFSVALSEFANAAGVGLSALIDYMVVQSAIKDNQKAELEYALNMKTQAEIQNKLGALWPWGRRLEQGTSG